MSQNNKPLIIAIDGPSASGKGTVAKKIAAHFNLPYLNTGALYRLVALRAIDQKVAVNSFVNAGKNDAIAPDDSEENFNLTTFEKLLDSLTKNITENELDQEALFGEDVGAVASVIAQNPLLRKKLFAFQQEFIANGKKQKGGAVLDGRDTTTVIYPDATHKFFITAAVEIRAQRRFNQLKNQGKNITYDEIMTQLQRRDENDLNRKDSPLKVAADAIIIDNGALSIEEGFQQCLNHISR